MSVKQVNKRIKKVEVPHVFHLEEKKNNIQKNDKDMTTEQIEKVENLVQNISKPKVKVVKKQRGLIERTESEKIVLTEDNRQVLND